MYIVKKAVVLFTLVLSLSANAGFISSDWKIAGDAQATLQEETGIEWLKLNNTANMSISGVLSDVGFEGWRLAEAAEVESLLVSMFPSLSFNDRVTRFDDPSYAADAQRWYELMGLTRTGNVKRGLGFYLDNDELLFSGSDFTLDTGRARLFDDIRRDTAGVPVNDYNHPAFGIFLVSDGGTTLSSRNDPSINSNNTNYAPGTVSVSEPAGAALMVFGAFSLMFLRRKKK